MNDTEQLEELIFNFLENFSICFSDDFDYTRCLILDNPEANSLSDIYTKGNPFPFENRKGDNMANLGNFIESYFKLIAFVRLYKAIKQNEKHP